MWTVTGIEDKTDMEHYLQEKPQQRKSSGLCTPLWQFTADLPQGCRKCLFTSSEYIN